MNKIQIEASLQLAQMDFEANPTPVNKTRLAQAQAAFDALTATVAKPAEEKTTKASKPKVAVAAEKPKEETPEEVETEETSEETEEKKTEQK